MEKVRKCKWWGTDRLIIVLEDVLVKRYRDGVVFNERVLAWRERAGTVWEEGGGLAKFGN